MADIKHLDAFEYYYSLGSARSYDKVAQRFNKSEKTVNTWGYKEKWAEEVRYRDAEQLKENRRLSLLGRRSKANDYKKIVEASIGQYVEKLKKGKIEIKSVKDLESLVKLSCYLDDFVLSGEDVFLNDNPVGVEVQSACATSKKRKKVVFDINGEPDREKDLAGVPVYDDENIYLNRLIPKIYNEYVWNVLFSEDYTYTEYVLKGGRNSVKSTVNAILYGLTLYMGLGDATASRLTYGKLRGSCFNAIIKQLRKMGIDDCFEFSEKQNSPLLIKCDTGFEGYFFGLDDEQKIRSFEPKNGTHFNWIEEIQVVKKFTDLSNLKATLMRYTYKPVMSYSTNPRPEKSWWTNVDLVKPAKTKYILHTTYLDIPDWWINAELKATIEDYKAVYPELYRNAYLGEVCGGVGLVFRRIKEYKADKSKFKSLLRGLDFGLAKNGDPTSYVVVALDSAKKELFILDEWFKKDTDYPEIAKAILKENVHNFTVFCDSADSGGIKQLRIEGVKKAMQCKKTRVDTGIKYLQGLTIYIDPEATPNVYREFTEYSYVENSKGDSVLSEKNNHTIDAVRYALSNHIEGNKK